jgi:epoxyqueuosine reductase
MDEFVKQLTQDHGDKAAIVPIGRLQDIRQDVENLKNSGLLNDFQKYIVNDLYVMDVPDPGFAVRSILVIASPRPLLARIAFHRKGKRIPLMVPASYLSEVSGPPKIEHYLNEFLNPQGYHVQYAPKLPRKLFAVRSGLGAYGRNNICYVEGMGSSPFLATYFSDIPCTEENWQDICQMHLCKTCKACLNNCPTGAITADRFLINNERCLTYCNEAGAEKDFPEWIPPSAHHTIYGCLRCQMVCPINKDYVHTVIEPAEFTEEETALLVEGKPFSLFPETLKQKVETLDMLNYLGALPRNLRVLFDREA